jgi:Protein of unknown function (DUF3300)
MFGPRSEWIREVALLCCVLVLPGDVALMAQQPADPAPAPQAAAEATAAPLSPDHLDSLVAPIALYPDPLLAQVLAASTYPLEIVQLRQWLTKHQGLKDKALADAVKKENWDPSIQSMAALPDVVKQMEENIKWTSELGNAFLAQQADVMDAVQRMRAKAKDAGKLTSNEQMKVETKVVESKSVVVIEQANPKVVYVPSYDPVVVWGAAPVYAYPPIVYPPGYYAAGMALSFGVGLAMGAMWGGGWGYGCGWGGGNNTININNNNNFNRNSNRTNNIGNGSGNRGNGNRGNGNWQHNPSHRGGAPYGDRATANKFGGSARGDSVGNRQANARQNSGQRGSGGVGDRSGAGASNRGGAGSGSNSFRSSGGAGSGAGGAANRGGDKVGNRQTSGGSGSRGSSAFGGGGSGMSGSSARSSGSRGASSMGGGSRGGGGGGGRRR